MTTDIPTPRPRATDAERNSTHTALSEALSRGQLSLSEFDSRSERAYQARYRDELELLLNDLPTYFPPPTKPERKDNDIKKTKWSILSTVKNSPPIVPEKYTLITFLGSTTLDLREAEFPRPCATIHVQAHLGAIKILVPPTVSVQVEGASFLGTFRHKVKQRPHATNGPILRVTGLSFLSDVKVATR